MYTYGSPLPSSPGLASSAAEARISAAELHRLRSDVFSREQSRQRALITRTEKIEVTIDGPGLQGSLLIMNKGLSTPYSCTQRKYMPREYVCACVCTQTDYISLSHTCGYDDKIS